MSAYHSSLPSQSVWRLSCPSRAAVMFSSSRNPSFQCWWYSTEVLGFFVMQDVPLSNLFFRLNFCEGREMRPSRTYISMERCCCYYVVLHISLTRNVPSAGQTTDFSCAKFQAAARPTHWHSPAKDLVPGEEKRPTKIPRHEQGHVRCPRCTL